jgi:hypothetical protein
VALGKSKSGFAKPKGASGEKVIILNNLELKTLAEAGMHEPARLQELPDQPGLLSRVPGALGALRTAGLQRDAYRRALPGDAETGRFSDHRAAAGGLNEDPDTKK